MPEIMASGQTGIQVIVKISDHAGTTRKKGISHETGGEQGKLKARKRSQEH
jgi:hypothetical protein